jgi:hypothetical protein
MRIVMGDPFDTSSPAAWEWARRVGKVLAAVLISVETDKKQLRVRLQQYPRITSTAPG